MNVSERGGWLNPVNSMVSHIHIWQVTIACGSKEPIHHKININSCILIAEFIRTEREQMMANIYVG